MTLVTAPFSHDGMPVLKLLQDFATLAMAGLAETSLGVPPIGGLWHDQPTEDCCSGLFVWVREWIPVIVGQFPTQEPFPDQCRPVDMLPRVVVSLRRPCAPIPDARGYVDPADEGAAAEDLIVDARALTCTIFRTWPTRLHQDYPGALLLYGPMTATGATTNCQGWDMNVLIELEGCRSQCGQ
jgi:hypothetical protein